MPRPKRSTIYRSVRIHDDVFEQLLRAQDMLTPAAPARAPTISDVIGAALFKAYGSLKPSKTTKRSTSKGARK